MKRFKFELQSLSDLKKREQDLQKKHLSMIDEKINVLNEKLDILQSNLTNTKLDMQKEINDSINAHKLNHYNNYICRVLAQEKHFKNRIIKEEEKKTACVNKLIEIQKELKSLEKLKQKKYDEYLKEVRKEEEKVIEDIISFKVAAS